MTLEHLKHFILLIFSKLTYKYILINWENWNTVFNFKCFNFKYFFYVNVKLCVDLNKPVVYLVFFNAWNRGKMVMCTPLFVSYV